MAKLHAKLLVELLDGWRRPGTAALRAAVAVLKIYPRGGKHSYLAWQVGSTICYVGSRGFLEGPRGLPRYEFGGFGMPKWNHVGSKIAS